MISIIEADQLRYVLRPTIYQPTAGSPSSAPVSSRDDREQFTESRELENRRDLVRAGEPALR